MDNSNIIDLTEALKRKDIEANLVEIGVLIIHFYVDDNESKPYFLCLSTIPTVATPDEIIAFLEGMISYYKNNS